MEKSLLDKLTSLGLTSEHEWNLYGEYLWIVETNKNRYEQNIVINVKFNKVFSDEELDYLRKWQLERVSKRITFSQDNSRNKYDAYVINLKHRTDRKDLILSNKVCKDTFNINIFEAHYNKKGANGCSCSHLSLITYAKEMALPWIIVIEDDNQINISSQELLDLFKLLQDNKDKWHVFNTNPTMADVMNKLASFEKYKCDWSDKLISVSNGQSTNMMIYNSSSYDAILQYGSTLQEGKKLAIDQYVSKCFHQHTWIKDGQYITRQLPSKSEIVSGVAKYDSYFAKSIKMLKSSPFTKEKTIGIFGIFMGKYVKYYEEFIKNVSSRFCPSLKHNFYIVTDDTNLQNYGQNVYFLHKKYLGWPYETLYRYKYFLEFDQKDRAKSDYIFFLNANAYLTATIYETICHHSCLTCSSHNSLFGKNVIDLYNVGSTAYITKKYKTYVGGRFFGGPITIFNELCTTLDKNITIDEANGIMATWHDESHLNWYVNHLKKFPVKLLPTSYHVPQESIHTFKNSHVVYFSKDNKLANVSKKSKFGGSIIKNKYNTFVSSKLGGGLGNIIFEIIAGMTYAKNNNKTYIIVASLIERQPHVKRNILLESIRKIFSKVYYTYYVNIKDWTLITQKSCYQYEQLPFVENNVVLQGNFQSEKYFSKDFQLNIPIKPNLEFEKYFSPDLIIFPNKDKDLYFLHVRLGDYTKKFVDTHFIDLEQYYQRCVDKILKHNPNAKFLVCYYGKLEDVKNIISKLDLTNVVYQDPNDGPLETLTLMSSCQGGIAANSSLSWLGLYLIHKNKNSQHLYMPSKWINFMKGYNYENTKDVYPEWANVVEI